MSDLNTDPILHDIVAELLARWHCHTVILYGSRARGDATPTSDYDVLGVKPDGDVERDARVWKGVYLDLFIYPEAKIRNPDESSLQMLGGKVLVEKEGLGAEFLHQLQAIFDAGPKKLAPDEDRARRVWAWKMLDRARVGDAEGSYRRHWLLTALLEDYFVLRGQWFRGPKESLRWLQTNQPGAFEAFVAALRPDAGILEIEELIGVVMEETPIRL